MMTTPDKQFECPSLNDAIALICSLRKDANYKRSKCIKSEIKIDSYVEEFNPKTLKDLGQNFKDESTIISIMDEMDSCIYWISNKMQRFVNLKVLKSNTFNNIEIIMDFITECLLSTLKEGNSGIIDCEYKKKELGLLSIGDSYNQNLLLVASKNGNEQIVDLLLKYGIKSELLESEVTAQSLALQNQHYDVLLQLLKSNLTYPRNIVLKYCPEKMQDFIEMGEKFHKMILEHNIYSLSELIRQNPNLRYFYNLSNQSALKVAAELGFEEIVEHLSSKGLSFAPHENTNKIRNKFKLRDSLKIPENHINVLVANTLFVNDESNKENQRRILQIYKALNDDPRLKIILQIVAATKNFQIIFDIKNESGTKIESAKLPGALGNTFISGIITIGAKLLHKTEKENDFLGTLIHEMCHYAILVIYENNFKPYPKNDEKAKNKFTNIFNICKELKEKESLILSVYNDYKVENQMSELIVRPAHLIAKYKGKPKELKSATKLFNNLFKYYVDTIIKHMEKSLPEIERKLKPIASGNTCNQERKGIESHEFKRVLKSFCKILEHKKVRRRKIYTIVYSRSTESKNTNAFRDFLQYLYDNFQSIKVSGNRRLDRFEENENIATTRYAKNPINIEIWNDVFIYKDFGILLVNIQNMSAKKKLFSNSSVLAFTKLFSSIVIWDCFDQDDNSLKKLSRKIVIMKPSNIDSFKDKVEHLRSIKDFGEHSMNSFTELSSYILPLEDKKDDCSKNHMDNFSKIFNFCVKNKLLFSNKNKVNTALGHQQSKRYKSIAGKFMFQNHIKLVYHDNIFKPDSNDYRNHQSVEELTQKFKNDKKYQEMNQIANADNPGCSYQNSKQIKSLKNGDDSTSTSDGESAILDDLKNKITPSAYDPPKFQRVEVDAPVYYFKLTFKEKLALKYVNNIFDLPEDVFVKIFDRFSNDEKLNLIFTSEGFADLFEKSRAIMKKFTLFIDKNSFDELSKHTELLHLPIININLNLEGSLNTGELIVFFNNFKGSVENLIIKNAKFRSSKKILDIFCNLKCIKSITLEKCSIKNIEKEIMPQIDTLESLSFDKCNDNIFKVFICQKSVFKFKVRNDDWTWAGFPHELFNLMVKNSNNLDKIELIGDGTGSFFDSDDLLFRVRKLVTTSITFHWYVGIKTERISFLKSQMGYLKELTIFKLPFDFDGGRVLKFIIEKMELQTFYYGKIPLILNGKKQNVKEFAANEIQIQSAFEMFRQFPSITFFRLELSLTDISSDDIERIINVQTNLFSRLEIFEVVDNSRYRNIFGVFLGLLKNMRNLRKLLLKTQDCNINTLLVEFLPFMNHLEEIYLPSTAAKEEHRIEIIKLFVPTLNKISVPLQQVNIAKAIFGKNVTVCGI